MTMTDPTDDAVTLETAMIRFGIRNDLNCTGEPRMTTERQHTLVPCATCGTGDQPKYMVLAGKTWLCTQCAGAEILFWPLNRTMDWIAERTRR